MPGQRFQAVFDQLPDPVCVVTPDGSVMAVNRAALDLFGYTREEALRANILDICAHPEERQRVLRDLCGKGAIRDRETALEIRKVGERGAHSPGSFWLSA